MRANSYSIFGLMMLFLTLPTMAVAQQATDPLVPDTAPRAPGAAAEAAAPAAPLVYLCDSAGRLGTINLTTKAVRVIGNIGVVLTDIAFAPNGTLYGVSFTTFYKLNKTTGRATPIGSLGVNGINALAFNKSGKAIAASFRQTGFFTINVNTGRATPAGSNGGYLSAGDFTYSGNHLYFSTSNQLLVDYNLTTNKHLAHPDHIVNLYGLVVPAAGQLYGFAGTTLYRLNPSTGAGTAVTNFQGRGLGQIYGAAFQKLF